VLSHLRDRYPDLTIENVSGGGNRLDLGMLRYSDAAWMDDRTTPALKVRHNIQGLSALFPPAYLLSFVIADRDEPLHDSADLPQLFRSRMAGILGLGFRTGEFGDDEADEMRREIDAYKNLRDGLTGASGTLLTTQASFGNGPAWDVFQTTPEGFHPIVLWAFQTDRAVRDVIVRPVGLRADSQYEVQSANHGSLGIMTGSSLMQDGVELVASTYSAADTILLDRVRAR
jgi:alpha-galactosidase